MDIKRLGRGILRVLSPFINDKPYLKLAFRNDMGRKLDFDNCQTMNEKLQWLKINNRYPELTSLVDKIEVKDIVASRIGKEYIIPTIKVWDKPEDMTKESFDSLPDRFVVKTNHSGGNMGVSIVKDKKSADFMKIKKKMARSLRDDIYKRFREWPYKDVNKRIFAEEYLGDNLVDYKFYCFNGDVDCVLTCSGRQSGHGTKFYFFDRDWNLRRYNKAGKNAPEGFTLQKPEGMDKMFELASELSKGFPFVRVDLYNVDGKIYFGELTFYPASGFDANRLYESDVYFGSKIDLKLAKNTID